MDNLYALQTPAWYEARIRELEREIAAGEDLRAELRKLASDASAVAERALARVERAEPLIRAACACVDPSMRSSMSLIEDLAAEVRRYRAGAPS